MMTKARGSRALAWVDRRKIAVELRQPRPGAR